jgi:hypothetical protein
MGELQPPTLPVQKFVYFPRLPTELRHEIFRDYQENQPGRFVEIRWSKDNRRFFVDELVPPLLHVCKESRKIALKFFELISMSIPVTNRNRTMTLRTAIPRLDASGSFFMQPPGPTVCFLDIYYNFDIDTLYLSSSHLNTGHPHHPINNGELTKLQEFFRALNSQRHVAERLRSLAIEAKTIEREACAINMHNMVNLERVDIVFGDSCCDFDRHHAFSGPAHKKAARLEQIFLPKIPTIEALFDRNSNYYNHSLYPYVFRSGYPRLIEQMDFIPALSEEERYAVTIGDRRQRMETRLLSQLNFNVDRHITSGRAVAREDWTNLTTIPYKIVREIITPRIRASTEHRSLSGHSKAMGNYNMSQVYR